MTEVLKGRRRKEGREEATHHGGDAIKPEAVKVVLLKVPPEVGEEETKDLPAAVVEEAAVPEVMKAPFPRVEVAALASIKLVQSIEDW